MRRLFVLLLLLLPRVAAAEDVVLPDYASVKHIDWYATRDEYDAAKRDARFRLTKIAYESDGLTVFAYLYAPSKPSGRLPVIVFNRGSYTWPEFAAENLTTFHRLAEAGFVLLAPMLRGSGGAPGRDELGGADVDDLMNTAAVIAKLPFADANNVFMYGASRGGMMTYQAIRDGYALRAAATFGGFTDFDALLAAVPRNEQIANQIWPDLAQNRDAIARRRSAVQWAEKLTTPLLIMHGGRDQDVPPAQSLALATRLEQLGRDYELVIRAGENHSLSGWRRERDALAIEWFKRHLQR